MHLSSDGSPNVRGGMTAHGAHSILPPGLRFGFVNPHTASSDVKELLFGSCSTGTLQAHDLEAIYRQIGERCTSLLSGGQSRRFEGLGSLSFLAFESESIPAKNLFARATTSLGEVFIKIAGSERSRRALARESSGLKIAKAAGVQVPELLCEYTSDTGGLALLASAFVSPQEAVGFPNSIRSRELVTPQMARAVALELLPLFRLNADSLPGGECLSWVEGHMAGISVFKEEFERRLGVLKRPECSLLADSCVRDGRFTEKPGSYVFSKWLEESRLFLSYLEERCPFLNYFCLGDIGPQNLFFYKCPRSDGPFKRQVIFYDLEVIGVAPHWALQALVDWGRFFHRISPNIEAQRQFLQTLVEGEPLGTSSDTAIFLRSLLLARVVMTAHIVEGPEHNPEYPRFDRLAALLESVGPALDHLERFA
jgi:hypothetical protein